MFRAVGDGLATHLHSVGQGVFGLYPSTETDPELISNLVGGVAVLSDSTAPLETTKDDLMKTYLFIAC